jgi:hypothetical protein
MASATFWNWSRLSHDWVMLSISERNNTIGRRGTYLFPVHGNVRKPAREAGTAYFLKGALAEIQEVNLTSALLSI